MTPALIMLVVPGLPSYNGVEVYYLKGVIGLPIVISFRDRWYTHIFFFFFFWNGLIDDVIVIGWTDSDFKISRALLLTHSSSDSAMITRSSAKRSSQGTPERNSRDKASSTMMKSSGLRTDPWWTPTFTSNSSLYPSLTRIRLRAFAYIPCTSRTIHSSTPSFLSAHQMTFRGTGSNAFSRSTKAM